MKHELTMKRNAAHCCYLVSPNWCQSFLKPINKTIASQQQIQYNTYCIKISSICSVTVLVNWQMNFVCHCYTQWPHPNDSTTGNLHNGYTTTRSHCDVFKRLPCPPFENFLIPTYIHYSEDIIAQIHSSEHTSLNSCELWWRNKYIRQ